MTSKQDKRREVMRSDHKQKKVVSVHNETFPQEALDCLSRAIERSNNAPAKPSTDNEMFGDDFVELVRRVAREEISFALRPEGGRGAMQKKSTQDHAETYGQEVLDLIERITKQEWARSESVLREGGALSLVTDWDIECFGHELVHVFRCGARDAIALVSSSCPPGARTVGDIE